MRAALIGLMLIFGSQARAECGKLFDRDWLKAATEADVQAELNGDSDVMARRESGSTPLHIAVEWGSLASIKALLAAGADVMERTKGGWTPLHGLGEINSFSKIKALLAAGADVMARTKGGLTPLHVSAEYGTTARV